MKIFHLSDTHGWGFWDRPLPPETDVVAHSGDLFPNSTRGIARIETPFQKEWLSRFTEPIKKWLDGRPLVYVPGNHDYYELADAMPAHRVSTHPITVCGKSWVGFREIPYIYGEWMGEVHDKDMRDIVANIFQPTNSSNSPGHDILLCHAPPAGMMDSPIDKRIHYGITCLATSLQFMPHDFKAVLFGHVHQNTYQQETVMGVIFSNAADTDGGMVELV